MEIAEKPEKFVSDEPSDVSSSTSSARNNEELKKLARSFTNLSTHTSSRPLDLSPQMSTLLLMKMLTQDSILIHQNLMAGYGRSTCFVLPKRTRNLIPSVLQV